MPFTHCLEAVMEKEFYDFMALLRKAIDDTGYTYDRWDDSHVRSPTIVSMTSNGAADKIKTLQQINQLYGGLPERFSGFFPILKLENLVVSWDGIHSEIKIRFSSSLISEIRLDWAYNFGLQVDSVDQSIKGFDIIKKRMISETIDLEFVIFSSKQLRSKDKFYDLYMSLEKCFLDNSSGQNFEVIGVKFSSNNSKCKKIQVW